MFSWNRTNRTRFFFIFFKGVKHMLSRPGIKLAVLLSTLLVIGCSATPVTPQGRSVELLTEKPTGNCRPLGDAVGSQGNWLTGDYTSNKNLLIGARNKLRNKAAKMGGNYVWVQNSANTNAWESRGTTNTTVLGVVYRCE
jgi:hypothetical protein